MGYHIDLGLNSIHLEDLENPYRVRKRQIKQMWGNTCAYCGAPDSPQNPLTIDHIRPKIHQQRDDHITNRIPACLWCNRSKSNHSLEIWYPKHPSFSIFRLKRILRWIHPGIDEEEIQRAIAIFIQKKIIDRPELANNFYLS